MAGEKQITFEDLRKNVVAMIVVELVEIDGKRVWMARFNDESIPNTFAGDPLGALRLKLVGSGQKLRATTQEVVEWTNHYH